MRFGLRGSMSVFSKYKEEFVLEPKTGSGLRNANWVPFGH